MDSKRNLPTASSNIINNQTNINNINNPNNTFNSNNLSNQAANTTSKKSVNFPSISENKKIFIHKPSDFTKNKYTYLGSLANNSEILSLENKRTYHSPRFSMNDIKQQIRRENKIIGSILKDEVDSLPRLLKNNIPILANNRRDKSEVLLSTCGSGKYKPGSTTGFNNIMLSRFQSIERVSKRVDFDRNLNSPGFCGSIGSKGFGYDSDKVAIGKVNRMINLSFLISSPKRKSSNFPANTGSPSKKSYYHYNTLGSNGINNIFNSNNNVHNTKTSNFHAKSHSMKFDYYSIDNNSSNKNTSENCNLAIKSKKIKNSFKAYLNAKLSRIESFKGNN